MKPAIFAIVAVCGVVAATTAQAAAIFSGSFTGLGTETVFNPTAPGGSITRLNVPTTGTFTLNIAQCQPYTSPSVTLPSCAVGQNDMTITFNTPDLGSFSFHYPGGLVSVINTPTTQELVLDGGYAISSPSEGVLTLAGPANAFLNGTDFQSLHPGTVDLANSSFYNVGSRTLDTNVQLTSVTFTDVPEPSSAALLGALACIGWAVRRNKRGQEG